MLLAENSSKLSAQSPACSKNALPAATWASPACSDRASPAKTSGGYAAICLSARSSSPSSGHVGCCLMGNPRHESGDQSLAMNSEPTAPKNAKPGWIPPTGFRKAMSPSILVTGTLFILATELFGGKARKAELGLRQRGPTERRQRATQTAKMRSASSRRPATARLTKRRAASAVTPRLSPTSRKLLRSPSSKPKRASTA